MKSREFQEFFHAAAGLMIVCVMLFLVEDV